MSTYIIDSEKFGGKITFKFNLNGVLNSFDIEPNLTLEQTHQFTQSVKLLEKELVADLEKHKVKHQVIPNDISFDKFWTLYDYKDGGSKVKAKQSFDKLNDYDKAAAIDFIKKYKQIKMRQNTALQYAASYINQRIWNN